MKRGLRGGFGSHGGESAFGTASGSSLSYLAEPPSFSAVSDPNVVVCLKNVLKKDSTTKAKGLEELIQYAQAHPFELDGGVEEAVLDIWTQIYARISIDNSRRVRELSHTLQMELLRSARKRMERHVLKIVGPWLSGLYDRDRVVARAANDGISSFLTTSEKFTAFWVKCQSQILDFAIEGIQETQETLSDERSTTHEDAEAKYFRVITASLSLALGLLQKVDDAGMQKFTAKYDDYFAEDTVWKSITFKDATVRKTVCQLLFACLDRRLPYAASTKARQAFVTGGLKTNQSGSAYEYVRALTKVTEEDSSFWAASSNDKKSPLTRLQSFISKGSQGSPPKFWEALNQLLALIPADEIGIDTATKLLSSVKAGISSREEPRTNSSHSWKCFVSLAEHLMKLLPDDDKLALAQGQLFPLFEQFLFSHSAAHSIGLSGTNAMTVLVDVHLAVVRSSSSVSQASMHEWERLSTILCANISGSLPEVSKEYKSSQENIGQQGQRWFALVGGIFGKLGSYDPSLPDQTAGPSDKVISQCVALLESRNMKPFGAAQIIEHALATSSHLFVSERGHHLANFFAVAADDGFDKLAGSASMRYLLSCLGLFASIDGHSNDCDKIWQLWIEKALELPDRRVRNSILAGLMSQNNATAGLAKDNKRLQDILLTEALATLTSESDSWELIEASLAHHAMNDSTSRRLGAELVGQISKSADQSGTTLRMLEMVASSKPAIFSEEPIHTELVAQLLSLSEINDTSVSAKVSAIRSVLEGQTQGNLPLVEIIQSNLERAGPQSLGLSTLVSQAKAAVKDNSSSWEDVLPNTNVWMAQSAPLLEANINPSLSLTSNIGGAVTLSHSSHRGNALPGMPRDYDGRSVPARMALYICGIARDGLQELALPRQFEIELLYLQCLAVQLASDQITTLARNGLWQSLSNAQALAEAEDVVTTSKNMLNNLVTKATSWHLSEEKQDGPSSIIRGLVDLSMKECRELSPRAVHSARVLSELLQALIDAHGKSTFVEEQLLSLDNLRAKPETALLAAGLISGLGESAQSSKAVSNFCNRLVSEVAGSSLSDEKTNMILALLAITAGVYETGELPVAKNRIVFAVKQVTSWLEDSAEIDPNLCVSICNALNVLLPCIKDVYGSYWELSLQFCVDLWQRAAALELSDALPVMHSSMKLMKTLERISEPNDDLVDALREFSVAKSNGLIALLRIDREAHSQPLEIVDGMLGREVEKLPVTRIPEPQELFGLMVSESRDIQTAAFSLLHKKIPADQEQQSIDVLLDKTDARLPDELLSLFLDPPTLEKFSDDDLSLFPSSIRGYLLSWKLVFDAYSASSFKIRNDFTEHLKTENIIDPLLDFMFDVLGHSAAHPLNLDKENLGPQQICDYDLKLADAELGEKSLHWLLVHVYYLTLKFIPGLFRGWYLNCRSKQTRIAVESWTTKYFAPIIVGETLDAVQVWSGEQEPPAMDEQELVVKVSKPAREVTASYEVDESQASIVIKVPASYPIETVTVSSLNRVVVSERKWQSWIMTTQGVITFSNCSIIDGLQVFKRNIVGALKGQSECAICYSIISTDKRMPDKRCTTCKNLFHRVCLYKWFQTSNQNTCPLCRNPIDYLGADTAKRRQG